MVLRTPLHEICAAQGAKFIDFGGWDLPVSFGSQIEEHHAVRRDAGVFDVSHMGIVDLAGARTRELLSWLLANDVAKLAAPGRALYSCLLRDDGGVIDDLIVYALRAQGTAVPAQGTAMTAARSAIAEGAFRLVVNASTRGKDLAWISQHAARFAVTVHERSDLAMLAVQGPNAIARTLPLLPGDRACAGALKRFSAAAIDGWFVARTGYTGEDGFEIMLPAAEAAPLWRALTAAGVRPIGLGARDTLRLEAGLNLYGNDMDETHHPLESGLEWTVAFEPRTRDFSGRAALEAIKARGEHRQFVGLLLEERGVLRSHQRIEAGARGPIGEVTSGTFSPTLNRSIALARIVRDAPEHVLVDIRGRAHAARVVKPPFVREGRILIEGESL